MSATIDADAFCTYLAPAAPPPPPPAAAAAAAASAALAFAATTTAPFESAPLVQVGARRHPVATYGFPQVQAKH